MSKRADRGPKLATGPLCQSGWASRAVARNWASLGHNGQSRSGSLKVAMAKSGRALSLRDDDRRFLAVANLAFDMRFQIIEVDEFIRLAA